MKFSLKKQALLIYELGNKNHLKKLMTKISHISWGGYDKGFYGIIFKILNLHIMQNAVLKLNWFQTFFFCWVGL